MPCDIQHGWLSTCQSWSLQWNSEFTPRTKRRFLFSVVPLSCRETRQSWQEEEERKPGADIKRVASVFLGHLHLRHGRVEVFSVRHPRDGEVEVVLILPRCPSLLRHPLLSFKPCSDLMSRVSSRYNVYRCRWHELQLTNGIKMHQKSLKLWFIIWFIFDFKLYWNKKNKNTLKLFGIAK